MLFGASLARYQLLTVGSKRPEVAAENVSSCSRIWKQPMAVHVASNGQCLHYVIVLNCLLASMPLGLSAWQIIPLSLPLPLSLRLFSYPAFSRIMSHDDGAQKARTHESHIRSDCTC